MEDVGIHLFRAARRLKQVLDEKLPLPGAQFYLLSEIDRLGQPRVAEVAAALGISPSTLSLTSNRLVEEGYVRRFYDPDDRRGVSLAVEEKGRDLLTAGRAIYRQVMAEVLCAFTPEDREVLVRFLARLEQAPVS